MRKSGKSMLFFDWKNIDFYIEGHTLKTNCIRFLILLYWRKKFCVHFEKYIFFYACFFIFSPFFSFDLFRRNLTLVLTNVSTKVNANWAFKHCTPPRMVLLASSTAPGYILIPIWRQKTTTWVQELHIPKYHHCHPSFLALFLHFFRISRCKCIA